MNDFSQDNSSMVSFLDTALWEEMNTSRAWVYLNYPVTDAESFQAEELQPYPILLTGESVINHRTGINPKTNKVELSRVIMRHHREVEDPLNPYHPQHVDTVFVHELDESGFYQIIIFEKKGFDDTTVIGGHVQQEYKDTSGDWVEVERETNILRNGLRLDYLPIFPLNGQIDPVEPMLSNMVTKEVALYNKMSRRNHLLYGTASYTPVIIGGDLTDDDKDDIVDNGLGSWIFLDDSAAKAEILAAPTEALQDLDRAVQDAISEMARLGIRILAPEDGTATSGVALEIRNASQTSQLATLNNRVSEVMGTMIRVMVNWRYNTEYRDEDFEFTLSQDFNPAPLGEAWLRLVNDMYEAGTLPRSALINVLKSNDILGADYDDEEGLLEIEEDVAIVTPREQHESDMALALNPPEIKEESP